MRWIIFDDDVAGVVEVNARGRKIGRAVVQKRSTSREVPHNCPIRKSRQRQPAAVATECEFARVTRFDKFRKLTRSFRIDVADLNSAGMVYHGE